MTKIIAGLTTSVDGYVAGPNDRPELGLGEGGEQMHYWAFGGPYELDGELGEATGVDKEFRDQRAAAIGAVIGGRTTFDMAQGWGGANPYPVPMFILTHRPEEEPEGQGFTFVGSLDEAIERGRTAAGDKALSIMGGASTIRQALAAGHVDELWLSVAPFVLGGGKRLFDGFTQPLELEPLQVLHSRWATHTIYRVQR